METVKKYIEVGSNVFFKGYDDFTPHDKDTLIIIDEPTEFIIQRQIRLKNNCYFEWKRMTPKEYIDYHKRCNQGLFLGKFLVPEFVEEIGFTIEDLKELSFLLDFLDKKHIYERIIFESYLENNDFTLTQEQRDLAYEEYKQSRIEN